MALDRVNAVGAGGDSYGADMSASTSVADSSSVYSFNSSMENGK